MMTTKKINRDILDDLLHQQPESCAPPEIKGLEQIIQNYSEHLEKSQKPVNRPRHKRSVVKRKDAPKKKTTHYLSEETFAGLDKAKEEIRKLVPTGFKTTISKSKIVNYALRLTLGEFESKGEKSALMKNIMRERNLLKKFFQE